MRDRIGERLGRIRAQSKPYFLLCQCFHLFVACPAQRCSVYKQIGFCATAKAFRHDFVALPQTAYHTFVPDQFSVELFEPDAARKNPL
jgi:hypothetical protein